MGGEAMSKARELNKAIGDAGGVLAQILDSSHEKTDVGRKSVDTPTALIKSITTSTPEVEWDHLNSQHADAYIGDDVDSGWDEFDNVPPDPHGSERDE